MVYPAVLPRTKDREEWDVGNGFLKIATQGYDSIITGRGLTHQITWISTPSRRKREFQVGNWKTWLSLRRKKRDRCGAVFPCQEWTLTGLQRVSSSSRRTERTQRLLTADFQKTFFPSLLTLAVPSMRAWDPAASQADPAQPMALRNFILSHQPSPFSLLNCLSPPCTLVKPIFPTPSVLPFDLLLPWGLL